MDDRKFEALLGTDEVDEALLREALAGGAGDVELLAGGGVPTLVLPRRWFLKAGVGTVAAWASILRPNSAEANPVAWWAARAIFAGAVSWLVGRALSWAFPQDPDKLDVQHVRNPRPSNDDFHNSFAERNVVRNPRYRVRGAYSNRCRYYVHVDDFVRCHRHPNPPLGVFSDLNTAELQCGAAECGGELVPVSRRLSPKLAMGGFESAEFERICRGRRQKSTDFNIFYVRQFETPAMDGPSQEGPWQEVSTASAGRGIPSKLVKRTGLGVIHKSERIPELILLRPKDDR